MCAASWQKSIFLRKKCTAGPGILPRRKQEHEDFSTQKSGSTPSSDRRTSFSSSCPGTRCSLRVSFLFPMRTNRKRTVLEMIKFEHSVFALPFALTGALLAARATHQPPRGWPSLRQVLWIVVAMVAARSAAMTMNRIADLRYDRENPRTKQRALATGALTLQFAWVFTVVAGAGFFIAAWRPNSLALKLAPGAIGLL